MSGPNRPFLRRHPDTLDATLEVVRRQIREGQSHPWVLSLKDAIFYGLPDRLHVDPHEQDVLELAAIHDWVVKNIRYTRDGVEVEITSDVEATLRRRQGDCDDHVALVGALVECAGHNFEIWLSGFDFPAHIFGIAYSEYEGKPFVMDTTLKGSPFGSASAHPNFWRVEF